MESPPAWSLQADCTRHPSRRGVTVPACSANGSASRVRKQGTIFLIMATSVCFSSTLKMVYKSLCEILDSRQNSAPKLSLKRLNDGISSTAPGLVKRKLLTFALLPRRTGGRHPHH